MMRGLTTLCAISLMLLSAANSSPIGYGESDSMGSVEEGSPSHGSFEGGNPSHGSFEGGKYSHGSAEGGNMGFGSFGEKEHSGEFHGEGESSMEAGIEAEHGSFEKMGMTTENKMAEEATTQLPEAPVTKIVRERELGHEFSEDDMGSVEEAEHSHGSAEGGNMGYSGETEHSGEFHGEGESGMKEEHGSFEKMGMTTENNMAAEATTESVAAVTKPVAERELATPSAEMGGLTTQQAEEVESTTESIPEVPSAGGEDTMEPLLPSAGAGSEEPIPGEGSHPSLGLPPYMLGGAGGEGFYQQYIKQYREKSKKIVAEVFEMVKQQLDGLPEEYKKMFVKYLKSWNP